MLRKVKWGLIHVFISLVIGFLGALVIAQFIDWRLTDIVMALGLISITLGGLKLMKDQTSVPLTSFTMRNNNARSFEDWMGHNTDLDEGMNTDAQLFDRDGLRGLLLNRSAIELIISGFIMMAIGFSAYWSYFI